MPTSIYLLQKSKTIHPLSCEDFSTKRKDSDDEKDVDGLIRTPRLKVRELFFCQLIVNTISILNLSSTGFTNNIGLHFIVAMEHAFQFNFIATLVDVFPLIDSRSVWLPYRVILSFIKCN